MVPEINLTPQLEARFTQRFAPEYGEAAVVSIHSGMTNPQRLRSWLAAHSGQARIVLGTRMAVFASMPHLRLIVVDEEHDPSYKSSEGARYSARDLAVYRGRLEGAKVVLGSATPSLESWHHSRPAAEGGRYLRLHMPSRIGPITGSRTLAHTCHCDQAQCGTTAQAHNGCGHARRPAPGAPGRHEPPAPQRGVFHPAARSHQGAHRARRAVHGVFEPARLRPGAALRRLRLEKRVPALQRLPRVPQNRPHPALPPLRLYRTRAPRLPWLRQPRHRPAGARHRAAGRTPGRTAGRCAQPSTSEFPEGEPVRVARIDADTTRLQGTLQTQLAAVHAGDVDVLVGTQMIAKGHDFRRITLVAAVNPDGALFSSDFRAPERLFAC
jgi:primosomal protein N' (replication factor Y)